MNDTATPDVTHTRILIVDDQDDVRLLLRTIIEIANHGLVVGGEAMSGEDALRALEDADPAVIVLDHMMPGMTGLETAEAILDRRPDLRIILFSAFLDDDVRRAADGIGVIRCIDKQHAAELPTAIWASV